LSDQLNIVVPMAGRGSRFREVGFDTPKPLIPIGGVPMVGVVVANIRPARPHRFIFVVLDEHFEAYDLGRYLTAVAPGCEVIRVDRVTEGPASTVLLARELISTSDPLMIANSDQWVDASINEYLAVLDADQEASGLIMTMTASDPKWSFVRTDSSGSVTQVAEKEPISDEATVGIYNYRRGEDFVAAADAMIAKNLRVNDEFYVAPAYNEMTAAGRRVVTWNIGAEADGLFGLGTPEDLASFLSRPEFERAVALCT
jgi:NDP-sugar pyrophosphorylase family protein